MILFMVAGECVWGGRNRKIIDKHWSRVSVTTGNMRQFLEPTQRLHGQSNSSRMPHQCAALPDSLLCLPAQSQDHGGDSRRKVVLRICLYKMKMSTV